jgi:hypothetical protein
MSKNPSSADTDPSWSRASSGPQHAFKLHIGFVKIPLQDPIASHRIDTLAVTSHTGPMSAEEHARRGKDFLSAYDTIKAKTARSTKLSPTALSRNRPVTILALRLAARQVYGDLPDMKWLPPHVEEYGSEAAWTSYLWDEGVIVLTPISRGDSSTCSGSQTWTDEGGEFVDEDDDDWDPCDWDPDNED